MSVSSSSGSSVGTSRGAAHRELSFAPGAWSISSTPSLRLGISSVSVIISQSVATRTRNSSSSLAVDSQKDAGAARLAAAGVRRAAGLRSRQEEDGRGGSGRRRGGPAPGRAGPRRGMAAASRLPSLVMAGVVGLAFTEAVGSVHAVARTEDCPGACAMAPALECSDLVVVEKLSTKYLHRHRRGDVVMLRSPHDPREHLFARLVALEGDRVRPAPAGWGGLGTKEVPQGCCCVEDNAQSEMVRRWRDERVG